MAFFSRHDSYIGLDIGTSSVKLVEIRREGKSAVRLATYASVSGANLLVEGRGGDAVARTATILREMLRRCGASSIDVVAALPSLSVFSAVLILPEMSERDLEKAVVFEARNYVPSPLKDIVLGWTVIQDHDAPLGVWAGGVTSPAGASPVAAPSPAAPVGTAWARASAGVSTMQPKARKTQEVFLTAAPKDLVQRYSSVIERLNLRLVALEIESFPLFRSLLGGESRPVFLVDIGAHATSFSIVDRGYLRLNQSIDLGGASLTTAVTQKLGLASDEAEKRKRADGLSSPGGAESPASAAMKPVLRDIVERSQSLRRLYEQKSKQQIAKVVLIGGGANMKGLPAFWSEVSGLPAEVGNPWKGIRVPAVLSEHLRILGPSFAVAVGLALREFEQSR